MMPAGYTVLEVSKGALIYECDRCGVTVLHVMVHDAWHATQAQIAEQIDGLLHLIATTLP